MIVELFGPAAAGKTTLARELRDELNARGIPARVVSSARPAEKRRGDARYQSRSSILLTAPLARASKVLGALGALTPGGAHDPRVNDLIATIPPGNWIRAVRARRYLAQLCNSWQTARESREVVIFDQGFLTALSSLALLRDPVDQRALARALKLIPKADLAVRLDTPREVLRARLQKRLSRQSRLERLFENDVTVSLRQENLCVILDELMAGHGFRSVRVSWRDHAGREGVVGSLAGEIMSHRAGAVA